MQVVLIFAHHKLIRLLPISFPQNFTRTFQLLYANGNVGFFFYAIDVCTFYQHIFKTVNRYFISNFYFQF